MHVFISWSGELSKSLAGAIRDWLPTTLQYVKPYFTPADIEKRAKWDHEISEALEASNFCIIAMTRESLDSKWIIFEAGALSQSIEKARICTVLFGIEPTDVQGPLERFQWTRFLKDEIHQLLKTINRAAENEAISQETLDRVFEKWWPDLEQSVSKITSGAGSSPMPPARSERDLLEEVFDLSRTMVDQQSSALDRLIKLLEASIQNRAIVNALFNPATSLAGFTSTPPSSGLGSQLIDFLRQPNASPGTLSEQLTEVAPASWTPELWSFRSPQWQESTHPMRRNSAGR